jgi:hypothetical protein
MGLHNKIDWPVEQMRQWYEVERKTVEEIGRLLGRSSKVVNKACKRFGFVMRRRGPKGGPEHPGWKGGRRPDKQGYILVHMPEHPGARQNGYIGEHRLVAEKMLGRYLLPTEVVHHKNDTPYDNRPENLQVFDTNGDHLRETLAGKCPKWTPEGRQRILESVRKGGRSTRRKRQERGDSTCSESPRRCSGGKSTDGFSPL